MIRLLIAVVHHSDYCILHSTVSVFTYDLLLYDKSAVLHYVYTLQHQHLHLICSMIHLLTAMVVHNCNYTVQYIICTYNLHLTYDSLLNALVVQHSMLYFTIYVLTFDL
jgi:hypothetical protein